MHVTLNWPRLQATVAALPADDRLALTSRARAVTLPPGAAGWGGRGGPIGGTAAGFGIDVHDLLAGKRRLTESQPFRAIFYLVSNCTDPDECAAPPNKQFVILSRSEHAWFNADEVPNVSRL